jgi:hypothetical protein
MCKQFSDAHTSTFAQATAARYLAAGRISSRRKFHLFFFFFSEVFHF